MKRWRIVLWVMLIVLLAACSQPQDQTSVPATIVPTSPNAAAQTSVPLASPSETNTTVTEPANEEITVSPETITVEPATTGTTAP